MTVLVAPDKFKGSLSATQVASHVIAGMRRARPDLRYAAMPVADGGEGTVDAAVAAGFKRMQRMVTGPAGMPVAAEFAWRDGAAVIELAQASGLSRLPRGPDPLHASTEGVGELIRTAKAMGAKRIVLGLGGSATTDGGSGMMRALGVRLLDKRGRDLPAGGGALVDLDRLDLSRLDLRIASGNCQAIAPEDPPAPGNCPAIAPGVEIVVASDVDNPLWEAAAVYGPQKGATQADVQRLEAGLARWAEIVEWELGVAVAGAKGAGAAGGVGFAALAFLGGTVQPGIGYLLDLLGFAERAEGARLVITGEGSLDEQTLRGKAVSGVVAAAAGQGVPAAAVAGRCDIDAKQLGLRRVYALTDLEPDEQRCMREPGPLLERLAERIEVP